LLCAAPLLGIICIPWVKTAFDFVNIESYSITSQLGRIAKREMGATQPLQEVFLCNIPLALLLMLGILLIIRQKNVFAKAAGTAIIMMHIATTILGGQRNSLALVGTLILVFINYRVRRLGLFALTMIFVTGFLTINIMSLVRQTNNPVKMVQLFAESIAGGNTAFLRLEESSEFITGQTMMRLIGGIRDGETKYTYGSSIFTTLLVFIPRALYPDRPLPLSERYLEIFYPGVRDSGGGYGFFYLMEGYWAFGLVGVLLFMTAYACIVQWIYKGFTESVMTDGMAMWYAYIIYALVFMAVRTGVIGLFKIALINSLPFIILYFTPVFRLRPDVSQKPRRRIDNI